MDALDLLVDFASFLASSTTIPKAANAEVNAQKSVDPSNSTKQHEQCATASWSIEQGSRLTADQKAMMPRKILPNEAYLPQPLRTEQLGGYIKATNLNIQPTFVHKERLEGPGSYVEPYAVEHATTVWNPRDHIDSRQAPPLWMAMHEYSNAVQPNILEWPQYPLFRDIPGVDNIGQMAVAGDGIYRTPCSMGTCNCRNFPPGFTNPVPTPPYERYDAGMLFGNNDTRGPPVDLSMQWH